MLIKRVVNTIRRTVLDAKKKKLVNEVKRAGVQYGLNRDQRDQKIIVSLTSYPARFQTIIPTLKSLLMQDTKPDRIILWYDCDSSAITKEMHAMEQYGIEFIHIPMNLKPHNKYYFAFRNFPEDLIITVDDDIVYPHDLIRSLFETHQRFPDCVVARRAHLITFEGNEMKPYNNWIFEYPENEVPGFLLLATGVGGVLYPPGCMDERVFDLDGIHSCLNADDIWLRYMEWLHGTKVVVAAAGDGMRLPPLVQGSQTTGLCQTNVDRSQNDEYISHMNQVYGSQVKQTLLPLLPDSDLKFLPELYRNEVSEFRKKNRENKTPAR